MAKLVLDIGPEAETSYLELDSWSPGWHDLVTNISLMLGYSRPADTLIVTTPLGEVQTWTRVE